MRNVLMGLVGAVGLLVCGCSTTDGVTAAGGSNEGVSQEQSPIFYGQADTTHQAVVALYKQSGNSGELCTGTIIAVNGSKGFVLTAAHCIADGKPDVVLLGNDINSQSIKQFAVSDAKAHPSYSKANNTYDFAMVTITGTSSSTPVIPAMTKENDNLTKGSAVTFVGYGRTETSDDNSKRNKVSGTLSSVSSIDVKYSQTNGGPCNGDSGGPSLSTIGGAEYVSSVTSYGDENCTVGGVSGRVSAVYDSFIKPYIDGTSTTLTCNECASGAQGSDGACGAQVTACQNSSSCTKFAQCVSNCGETDTACFQNCESANTAGADVYYAISKCICDTGCATECADQCQGSGGQCAYDFSGISTDCGTCADGACCDEQKNCADDATCNKCLTTDGATGCNANAAFQAIGTCLQNSCATPCGFDTGTGGTSGSAGSSSGTAGKGGTSANTAGTGDSGQGEGGADSSAGGSESNSAGGSSSDGEGGAGGGSLGNVFGGSSNNEPRSSSSSGGCSAAPTPGTSSPFAALALGLVAVASRRRRQG